MMQKTKNIDIEVLLKYLESAEAGEAKDTIQRWLDGSGTKDDLYKESLKFWNGITRDLKIAGEYQEDAVLNKIHHHIKIEEGVFLRKNRSKTGFIRYLSGIAAVLFIPLCIVSLWLLFQVRSFRSDKSWVEIQAPYGTRTEFHLPDGSTGHLNGGSTITYPVRFNDKIRNVKLTGEAFFRVVSNQRRPFIVSTERIDVKATGTSFDVMAYPDEETTEVTLLNGKVEVFSKKEHVPASLGVLKPNESLIYDATSDFRKIVAGNSEENLSWIDGRLVFKYEPFVEVVRKINRWYNVSVEMKDTLLASYIYYGTFQNETLDEVLKLLQYTAPIQYKNLERKKKPDGTFEKRKIEIYYSND